MLLPIFFTDEWPSAVGRSRDPIVTHFHLFVDFPSFCPRFWVPPLWIHFFCGRFFRWSNNWVQLGLGDLEAWRYIRFSVFFEFCTLIIVSEFMFQFFIFKWRICDVVCGERSFLVILHFYCFIENEVCWLINYSVVPNLWC